MSLFEKIELLLSYLGISIVPRYDENGYVTYHAKILDHKVACCASILDIRTIDAAFKYNVSWSNNGLRFNPFEVDDVLECLVASHSFKVLCSKNIHIGNPFFKHFDLISCRNEEELRIKLDLLNINDMHDKNINDIKEMLEV